MIKKKLALVLITAITAATFIGCENKKSLNKPSDETKILIENYKNNVKDSIESNIKEESQLPYETINLNEIKKSGFENIKDKITYNNIIKDYVFKGEVSVYRIDFVDGNKAVVTDTGKSGRTLGINFEGVLNPKVREFITIGIDKDGKIYLAGDMTSEEPHSANNN